MNTNLDPVVSSTTADRLYYSTGELLGADDFRDEQTYHRRQLARALLHLHGSGTIAGLRVTHTQRTLNATDDVELEVAPGLALDHAGRLIEVPRDACLRLPRWYNFIAQQPPSSVGLDAGNLRDAWRVAPVAAGGVVVADVFLAFHECPREYTPAFATGPFDSLDASQPARIRDGYELSLVLRSELDGDLPSASDPWSEIEGETFAERLAFAGELSLTRWYRVTQPAPENPLGVDPTAVLLARIRIPAQQNPDVSRAPIPDWSAAAWPNESQNADNTVRHVVLPPAAVARLIAP